MVKINLKLNSVTSIERFVHLNVSMPFYIDVASGRYVVDGKSIMGIFSIDASNPVDCILHSDEKELLNIYKDRLSQIEGIEVRNID